MKACLFIVSICVAAVISCCTFDDSDRLRCPDGGTELQLSIGNPTDVVTRSVATANERKLSNLFLLVFGTDGYYKGGEMVNLTTQLSGTDGEKTRTLKTWLPIATGDRVVVLANTNQTVLPTFSVGTSTVDNINAAFSATAWSPAFDHVNPGYEKIPMAGSMIYDSDERCKLIRAIAKLQVSLAPAITGAYASRFTVNNITWDVCNTATKKVGVIYNPDYTARCLTSGVSEFNSNTLAFPYRTTGYGSPSADLHDVLTYLYEWPNATKTSASTVTDLVDDVWSADRFCLIVKDNEEGLYYRLDLYDHESGKYLDIRRNSHYVVTITKVNSAGYTTADEALANPGSNLEYEVRVTDEDENVVISNGQYGIVLDCEDLLIYHPENEEFVVAKARFVDAAGTGLPSTNAITSSANVTLLGATSLNTTAREIRAKMTGTTGTVTITVGNITKVISIERRDAVDAHYCKLEIPGDYSRTTWTRNENNSDIHIDGTTSLTVRFPENVTPTNAMNLVDDKSVDPVFESKRIEGYVSRNSTGMMKLLITQVAPEYVGWLGGQPGQTGDSYYSKRLIIESIEEVTGQPWSTNTDAVYPANTTEFGDGMVNTTLLMSLTGPQQYVAAYYCYMKNDVNGNGVIDSDEPIKWYLPAQKQLMGIYCDHALLERAFVPRRYWTSTEASGDKTFAWYIGFRITHMDGMKKTDISAGSVETRVRCVRDID